MLKFRSVVLAQTIQNGLRSIQLGNLSHHFNF